MNSKQSLDSLIDTYLFDGPHSREDHINGVKVIQELNFDSLIFVVDDWCGDDVQDGTLAGLECVNAKLVVNIEVFPKSTKRFQYSRWQNECCFFILER